VPKQTLQIFAAKAGTSTLTVSRDGKKLYEQKLELPAGLSVVDYDLVVNNNSVKQLQRLMAKQGEKGEVKKADDDRYYLTAGEYTVTLSQLSHTASHTITIKAPR